MLSPARARLRIARVSAACPDARPRAADAALERGDALLEDVGGRVHDPGVDVAELLEPEEAGGVGGVVEDVAGGGVDRDRAGVRRGIRRSGRRGGPGSRDEGRRGRWGRSSSRSPGGLSWPWLPGGCWSSRGPWGSSSAATRRCGRRTEKPRTSLVRGPGTSAPRSPLSLAEGQRGEARRPSSERRGRPRMHISQETVVWLIRWRRMGDEAGVRQARGPAAAVGRCRRGNSTATVGVALSRPRARPDARPRARTRPARPHVRPPARARTRPHSARAHPQLTPRPYAYHVYQAAVPQLGGGRVAWIRPQHPP